MNKEEILARSRQEKKDEGVEYALDRGRRAGITAMSLIFMLICIFNFWQGYSNYAVFAMYWMYFGFESYGRYVGSKQKISLMGMVLGIVTSLTFFAAHVMYVLRG